MNAAKLTCCSCAVHKARMRVGLNVTARGAALLGAALLGGCITVNAPEEPIVIELNINITQEVIYRLLDDVRDNIESNPEIF